MTATAHTRLPPLPEGIDPTRATALDLADEIRYTVPVDDGRNFVQVTATALFLLRAAHGELPLAQVRKELSRRSGTPVSEEDVRAAYGRVIDALATTCSNRRTARPGTWLVLPIIPERVVQAVARPLRPLLSPWSIAVVAALAGLIPASLAHRGLARPDAGSLVAGYLLFVVVILLHEFGHAAATSRGGGQPRTIGFLMYVIWPCFYTDVTESWRLDRRSRMLVDAGGVVAQLLTTEIVALAFLTTGWSPLGYTLVLSLVGIGMNLNPLFRFDGYWMLGDALGVADLGRSARDAFLASIGRAPADGRFVAPWRRRVLSVWAVLSWVAWTALTVWVLTGVHARVVRVRDLVDRLDGADPTAVVGPLVGDLLALVVLALLILRTLLFVGRKTAPLLARSR